MRISIAILALLFSACQATRTSPSIDKSKYYYELSHLQYEPGKDSCWFVRGIVLGFIKTLSLDSVKIENKTLTGLVRDMARPIEDKPVTPEGVTGLSTPIAKIYAVTKGGNNCSKFTQIASTDSNGRFSINLPDSAALFLFTFENSLSSTIYESIRIFKTRPD